MRTPSTEAFWASFKSTNRLDHDDYVVVSCGDGPELADELAALIVAGTKRATASLVRDYGSSETVPRSGDLWVVVDGSGAPHCICRTTSVRIGPLDSVDDAFAWDEGEDDRTRASWLDNHRRYFARQAAGEGFTMHDDIETVFERFEVVWPPHLADPPRTSASCMPPVLHGVNQGPHGPRS
jgi:uncharacterized protein YhfF